MRTREEQMTAGGTDGDHNFLGDDKDYRKWFGVAGRSRDSQALERSNFVCILKELGGESDTVRVERYGHWAVGWIEEIYVKPDSVAFKKAEAIQKQLEDYPVYDDDHFSQEEQEEANETWKNCFDKEQRIEYIREHKSQFEFRSFTDIRDCILGKYFSGYANELIG